MIFITTCPHCGKDLSNDLRRLDITQLVQIQAEISLVVQEKLKEMTKQVPELRVKQK